RELLGPTRPQRAERVRLGARQAPLLPPQVLKPMGTAWLNLASVARLSISWPSLRTGLINRDVRMHTRILKRPGAPDGELMGWKCPHAGPLATPPGLRFRAYQPCDQRLRSQNVVLVGAIAIRLRTCNGTGEMGLAAAGCRSTRRRPSPRRWPERARRRPIHTPRPIASPGAPRPGQGRPGARAPRGQPPPV